MPLFVLHIAMQSLNISEGDEVIVPDITWVATQGSILFRSILQS